MIAVGNVIHKGKGSFTHVENTIFFDHGLSLKAKGIYCQIRSLESNPEWVFTIKGFASLVRDGADAVTAGVKELEDAGYVIRARKRSQNGRFLKAEEAVWITLDDPALYDDAVRELKADGFAVLSEFKRERDAAIVMDAQEHPESEDATPTAVADETVESNESEAPVANTQEVPDSETKPQVGTRTGKSRSGKATSGKSAPINYSLDKPLNPINPSLSPQDETSGRREETGKGHEAYRKGEFPEAFERLCELSLKPVESLAFKRDCFGLWRRRVDEGYAPEEIVCAYESYAKSQWIRNGDDKTFAKNLARWLECESGLKAYANEPIPPDIRSEDGSPLSMAELAEADPAFAVLWRKVTSRRRVICSYVLGDHEDATREQIEAAIEADEHYRRYMGACKESYERYVDVCGMLSAVNMECPSSSSTLMCASASAAR